MRRPARGVLAILASALLMSCAPRPSARTPLILSPVQPADLLESDEQEVEYDFAAVPAPPPLQTPL